MKASSYYIAKTPCGKYVGAYSRESVEALVQSGEIKPEYFATVVRNESYREVARGQLAHWVTVDDLLSNHLPPGFEDVRQEEFSSKPSRAQGS